MEPRLIQELFEAQVTRAPHAIAALCSGKQISYQTLNAQANQLAHHLKTLGVGPGVFVAVYMERTLDILPALLGILKAGGAYVPLEVSIPQARVQWILTELQIPILITHQTSIVELPPAAETPALNHIICLGKTEGVQERAAGQQHLWTPANLEGLPQNNLPPQASPQDLAYIIFTSGSTGTPKGVMVCHQPVLNLISWVNTTFQVQASDRLLFITSLCFDLSVYDIFGILAAGGSIHIATEQDLHDPERLLFLLRQEPITFWDSAPAAFQQLVPLLPATAEEPGTENLRLVFFSGDWIPVKLPDALRQTFAHAQVISLGGATEATVWSNYYPIDVVDPTWVSIPYGKPIRNACYYILDADLLPCPVGVAGDLYIGGTCLSTGYIGEPALTAMKFLPDPFSGKAGARLYQTGDLARFWPDGNIEFLGRADQQVKVRGFRVELGEVETTLSQHAALQDVAIVAREYADREKRIIAYLVPDQQRAFPVRQLVHMEQEELLKGYRLAELPNGLAVFQQNPSETEFMYQELFEKQTGLPHGITLNAGNCVFDVGANIGLFSLLVGRSYPELTIYAFEPIPKVFELLSLNNTLYDLQAKLFACGLSRTSTTETLIYYPHASILSGRFANAQQERETVKAFLLNQREQDSTEMTFSQELLDELLEERLRGEPIACPMRTLSEIIREQGVARIDLLKIDVEKSEYDVLAGIEEEDWPKIRQVMVEVTDFDQRLEKITELLEKHGFTVVVEQEPSLRNTNLYNLYAVRSQLYSHLETNDQFPISTAPPIQPRYTWSSKTALVHDIRRFLKERLPEYMLPAAFVWLDSLPLTANGKVDRKALPEPMQDRTDHTLAAPRTKMEELLTTIWSSVLGVQWVGITDDFFELGGNSLLVTQVVTRVRELFKVDLPLSAFFEACTIARLANTIEASRQQEYSQERFRLRTIPRLTSHHPLSFPQEQIWFLQQLNPENKAYHFQATLTIKGALDIMALEQSLGELIRRHEIFRTTFDAIDGRPMQMIHTPWPVRLQVVDLSQVSADARVAAVESYLAQEFRRPFVLNQLPLIRWSLLCLDEQQYILTHAEHHLLHDGWSFNTFLSELQTLYKAYMNHQPSPLPELPVQFVDFVYWQRQWFESEMAHKQLAYWKKQLADGLPLLALPADHPRPQAQTFQGRAIRVEFPSALCNALRARSLQEGCTLYMVMLAAFLVLLHRYTGQEDICLGTGIANRRSREAEHLIGMIINTLVLRTDLSGNPTFRELLARVREVTLGAYEHQDLPFEKVVEALHPERNLSYNPFFQVIFGFHDSPLDALQLPGLDLILEEGLSNGSAKVDLNVILIPRAEHAPDHQQQTQDSGMTMIWEYNTGLFELETMQRMAAAYQALLEDICADSTQRIATLPLLPSEECKRQVIEWNATRTNYPTDQCIHQLFEAQVKRTPQEPALIFDGKQYSYEQLNAKANQLARYLRRLGVQVGDLIGLYLERSQDLIVAMLAILKAGAAYVPMDLAYPQERVTFMMQDAQIHIVLTQEKLLAQLPSLDITYLPIDQDQLSLFTNREPVENLPCEVEAESLAYVIYTSGSTGLPKGVAIPHRGVTRLVMATNYMQIELIDRVAQVSNTSFDAATFEIWGTLLHGAQLVGVPQEVVLSPQKFAAFLRSEQISVLFLTTAILNQVALEAPDALISVRTVLFGGEAVDPERVKTILEKGQPAHLLHVYGPTENTTFSTWYPVEAVSDENSTVPIGYPLSNSEAYILDRHLQLVPPGVAGELYLGGAGLAQGYLHRPDLTAEYFVPHLFSQEPGARLYGTGDLVRVRSNGAIEFLGRLDSQIKLRGFRIEPGEIEFHLCQHPDVREAVVVLREEVQGGKRLIAYLVPEPGQTITPSQMREFLQAKLPGYMIPSAIVTLEQLPLNPNGKLDRLSLPIPGPDSLTLEQHYAPPRNPFEGVLVKIWAEVLGLERIGIYDNFFELGGHSLLATQVISRAQMAFQMSLPLKFLFEQPTVAGLASMVERLQRESPGPALHRISRTKDEDDAGRLLATLEQLSDEEVDSLLREMLPEYEGEN